MIKTNASKKRYWIIAGVAILVLAAVVFFISQKSGKTAGPASVSADTGGSAKAVLAVETVYPKQQDWSVSITMNGAVSAWQEAQVSAEIGGLRIKQVLVDVGSQVKRGQDLVLLADETVVADLHKQQATVARDRASLAEAKSNADRARQIKDSGALSSQQINQYVIAEETAQANLNLSLAELENQQIRLRQTHVTAADDGVISSRSANLGNVVASGAELFRLIRQGRIEWRGEVNAQQLAQIKVGQKVNLILPDNRKVSGTVRMKAPTVDVNTRNALVYVDLPKASAEPGMYAQGTINVGTKSALAVPQSALVLRDGRSYLYEVQSAASTANQQMHRVNQRSVITGRREGDLVEILDGLTGNPELVLTGGAFLNDGDVVTVVDRHSVNKTSANQNVNNQAKAGADK